MQQHLFNPKPINLKESELLPLNSNEIGTGNKALANGLNMPEMLFPAEVRAPFALPPAKTQFEELKETCSGLSFPPGNYYLSGNENYGKVEKENGGKRYSLRERKHAKFSANHADEYKKIRCHYCLSRSKNKRYRICLNYPRCLRGFCHDCLKKVFRANPSKSRACAVCQGLCGCFRCLKEALNASVPKFAWNPFIQKEGLSFSKYEELISAGKRGLGVNNDPLKGSERNFGAIKENSDENSGHIGFGNLPIFSAPLVSQYYTNPALNGFLPFNQFSYQPIITNTNFQLQPTLKETQRTPATIGTTNCIGVGPEKLAPVCASRKLQGPFRTQQAVRDAGFPEEDEVKPVSYTHLTLPTSDLV
eukprot:TRINITY_DN10496_c0_g1_i12.p1 TRINITY_DN10496_c0_g1~~TRINITY_DN10496_c0_g1_i12.p1  ORF type:complete len:362 (+),score=39.70 TRINITY_DN10496_c0_g1_i12:129-1214(+)